MHFPIPGGGQKSQLVVGKPSEHWSGFTSLDPKSDKNKRIQLLLSSANFEYLKTHAIELRRRHQPSLPIHVECTTDLTHFASGFNNLVLEVAFSDNVNWIPRIPHQALDEGDRISMLSEIVTMKITHQHTTVPIPQIFDFETFANQPFGYPYVFMEYLSVRTLPNGVATTIPPQHHTKAAKQLSNVFAELQNLTFSRIGRLWARTGIMAMHPDEPDWLTAYLVLKSALTQTIIEDRVRGPFPLCHLDLHFGNMLFDNEYKPTGVIDWSSAQAAPLEQLPVCPEFVTFPGLSDEENRPIVELKKLVVGSLREMERTQEKRPHLGSPAVDMTQRPNLTPLSTYMVSKRLREVHGTIPLS
ncbi:kinase-like domain-containing protein [Dactylonectria macrodidyma]|uniref:Kinase-like domain-containing protein n=1 Tax=Dactylonectria macrodidyma TaxID=307937 RepID=A0A9P9FTE7_9HYPO|nr:kinase-like domain-containing protein [Dactylonectria macrodidyma]